MQVEVLDIRNVYDPITGELMARHVELELTGSQGSYLWRAGNVPPDATRAQAQQYVEAHFDEMYAQAVARGERVSELLDIQHADLRLLLKAVALVYLDAINTLRVRAGLAEVTPAQLAAAVRTKYQDIQ